MTTARELLAASDLLLLDFDGPVTKLLPPPSNAALTDRVRTMALDLGVHLDADEMTTTDHLAIIRAAHRDGTSFLIPVEREATRLEVEAAANSPITTGARELLHRMCRAKKPVIIVTNNSPECVEEFLQCHNIASLTQFIFGRDPMHIARMKPSPWMLNEAVQQLPNQHPLMLGDSPSDMAASTGAGIAAIGLAKDDSRSNLLTASGAAAIVRSILDLL